MGYAYHWGRPQARNGGEDAVEDTCGWWMVDGYEDMRIMKVGIATTKRGRGGHRRGTCGLE